jgi:hypothetical protein
MLWSLSPGLQTAGTTIFGSCDSEGYCTPDVYTPGIYLPGHSTLASQAPIRVFLVGAFVALVYVAVRTRTAATRRIARAGTVCLVVASLLAAGHHSPRALVCVLAALVLSAPPAWRNPRNHRAFGTAPPRR